MDNRTYFERKDENVVVEEVFIFKSYGGGHFIFWHWVLFRVDYIN